VLAILNKAPRKTKTLTIHPAIMYSCDRFPPCLDITEMLIEETEIQRGIGIGAPSLIDERGSSNIDCFDSHALNIIQTICKPLEVTTVAELGLPKRQIKSVTIHNIKHHARDSASDIHDIMFEGCAVDVVVGWITVNKLVKEKGVEGHSPVGWTWMKAVVIPDSIIVKNIDSGFVLVKIVLAELLLKP
jgi:hypothetical protein